jgi:hypothetical protein
MKVANSILFYFFLINEVEAYLFIYLVVPGIEIKAFNIGQHFTTVLREHPQPLLNFILRLLPDWLQTCNLPASAP